MKTKCFFFILLIVFNYSCINKTGDYVCKPCDLPCDELNFDKPGNCPHCGMILLKKSEVQKEVELIINQIDFTEGSGVFLIEGGKTKVESPIKVYYHMPQNFTKDSKILWVVPGAGRNGNSYRDSWIATSEKYGVLILSPMYAEEDYSFEEYHLGGLIKNSNIRETIEFVDNTNIAKLDEATFTFEINTNPQDWIFNDFDRIFDLVVEATNSSQTQYDIFGHSAGGQILHRSVIFFPQSKANRIIASNSGFYTTVDSKLKLPFGIQNTPLNNDNLKQSFNKKMLLLIGELDNENENGGTLLHSVSANQQGAHRLARGQYFYHQSEMISKEIGVTFNWEIKIVPNVGHDHQQMSIAAAEFLYGEK